MTHLMIYRAGWTGTKTTWTLENNARITALTYLCNIQNNVLSWGQDIALKLSIFIMSNVSKLVKILF